jgi:quercetin dioxygenase-like cupin family protein
MSGTNEGLTDWRRVVTGHGPDGKPVILLDASIITSMDSPTSSGPILTLSTWPSSADDGELGATSDLLSAGGIGVTAVELVASSGWIDRPEHGQFPTLDAYVVVAGELVVGLDDGETTLRSGEVLIVRGQPHRLRPGGDVGARFVVAAIAPDPAATAGEPTDLQGASGTPKRVRRVVLSADADHRTFVAHDGDPATSFFIGEEDAPVVGLADVWETGGPVVSVDQGGDPTPPWQLEPRARGLKVLSLEMMPTDTGPGSGDEGWHATDTIDVDIVIDGAVELYLPELPPVSLSAGDILIQRATNHRWRAIGDRHLRMITIMIAVRS